MVKKLDRWCDNLWIYFMCAVGGATLIYLVAGWNTLPLGAKAGAFGAIIMPLHVIEEWKLPGGLHYFYNMLLGPKGAGTSDLNRYPMSRLTDMVTNIGLQFFPLAFLVLSNVTGLSNAMAVCMMLFCFLEVAAHTIAGGICLIWYRKAVKRTIYNPGFATSYLLFLPAGIYLACRMPHLTSGDWLYGLAALAVAMLCCIPLQETPLKKWVMRQERGMFAFQSPKYYAKFTGRR